MRCGYGKQNEAWRMKKLRLNRTYECIKDIVITTMYGKKLKITLKDGCCYHVNVNGMIETHEGNAKVTDAIAECLVPYRDDKEVRRWTHLRNIAAVHVLTGLLSDEKYMESLRKYEGECRVPQVVAKRAISQTNILVKTLINTEDEWLQELKYI